MAHRRTRQPHQMPSAKPPIVLTDLARTQLLGQLQGRNAQGIILRLRTKGCSGLSYVMDYATDSVPDDYKKIDIDEGQFLFIHPKALLFVIGTEMDYQSTPTRSGFVFSNPNEKGRCGCGSSFHV